VVERVIRTGDGRTLAVWEAGDPDGRPVLVHMGTPNSRLLYSRNVADAAARGLRLISYDRPGYGGSAPSPGRSAADCASDVRAICAALGVDRMVTWGISGGGPHVLACAALLPDMVAAAASLASPAPYGAAGLDWFTGMGQENVDDVRLMFTDEDAARQKMAKDRAEFLAATPADLADGMRTLLTPTDAAALTGELADWLTHSTQDGLAPGDQGWWDDSWAEVKPWGFELAQISVPVLVMHGREDKFVPLSHGEWLAASVPGAEARLLDHDGHLTLLQNRAGEMHSWLASHR
jgi:pimeloyl-ACP methyl ester carboxylesterase